MTVQKVIVYPKK